MSLKIAKTKVGENTYELTQVPAIQAWDLYNQMSAALAPMVPKFLAANGDAATVGLLVMECKRALPRELLSELRCVFARNSKVLMGQVMLELGEDGIFNQVFGGRMQDIDAWMIACAKFTFSGFLSDQEASAVAAAAASK